MLFNSLNFALFLPIAFFLYWFAGKKNIKAQNVILLILSYFFYGSWHARFLLLLIFSTLLDYYTGLKINNAENNKIRKGWLLISICVNLGFLGLFKYYNFFVASFADGMALLGIKTDIHTLQLVLPIGISFYTFHGLSYVIDIYKRRILPEKNFFTYSVFVSFFPLLVAGPIERATHLLPQIKKEREIDYYKMVDGLRQILWGLFKKVVIADNCAEYANLLFNHSMDYKGSSLVLGTVFFAFQIYCDFSGYSDIAIGTAKLFGIDLLRNFAYPYFSRDIAEFWRRWHISLSSWFRDYVYIPLGGNKGNTLAKVRNVFIIFLLSGFWHGANWTYIFWGMLNAIYILPSILLKTNRNNIEIVAYRKLVPSLKDIFSIAFTFCLTSFAWIFFRSENIKNAFHFISRIFSKSLFSIPSFPDRKGSLYVLLLICCLVIVEWCGKEEPFAIAKIGLHWPKLYRRTCYLALALAIYLSLEKEVAFIYFQF